MTFGQRFNAGSRFKTISKLGIVKWITYIGFASVILVSSVFVKFMPALTVFPSACARGQDLSGKRQRFYWSIKIPECVDFNLRTVFTEYCCKRSPVYLNDARVYSKGLK